MKNKIQYRGVIKYKKNIVHDFQVNNSLSAIAKLARLIMEEYPHAEGEVIDSLTGKIVHQCRQCAIC